MKSYITIIKVAWSYFIACGCLCGLQYHTQQADARNSDRDTDGQVVYRDYKGNKSRLESWQLARCH